MGLSPKVTIITITRNSERYITEAVTSVLSQSFSDFEYIIVDGDSTDRTLDLIHGYGDRRIRIFKRTPCGISDAMNYGIEMARGSIVGILHSDDIYLPDAISNSVSEIESTDSKWSYGQMKYVDEKGHELYSVGVPFDLSLLKRFMLVNHPTVFCKREVYEQLGAFNREYRLAMDYDLALRFSLRFPPHYIAKPLAKMRLGGASSSSFRNEIRAVFETLKIKQRLIPADAFKSWSYSVWSLFKIVIKYALRNIGLSHQNLFWFRRLVNPNINLSRRLV